MPLLPTQNKPQQQAGTGFTNLSRYLQANKANKLGGAVSSGIQQAGQQAGNALNQAGQAFQQGVSAEKERLGQQSQYVGRTLGNIPEATDKDVSNFGNILNAQSLGPTGVSNAAELRSKSQEAQKLGQATGSEAGRFGLLQRYIGRGNQYSAGQQNLDQMLLGQTGQQQLRSARSGTIGLGQQAERQFNAAQAQGQELQGQARQLAESTTGQLKSSVTDYDKAMADRLAQKQAETDAIIKGLSGFSENKALEVDPELLKRLGDLSGGVLSEGAKLYNVDLSPYIQANQLYANKQGVQTADDLAKAQMIEKLSNQSLYGTDAFSTLSGYTGHPELAGQYDANDKLNIPNQAALANAIQEAKKKYESEASPFNYYTGTTQADQNRLRGIYGYMYGSDAEAGRQFQADQMKAQEIERQQLAANPNQTMSTLDSGNAWNSMDSPQQTVTRNQILLDINKANLERLGNKYGLARVLQAMKPKVQPVSDNTNVNAPLLS